MSAGIGTGANSRERQGEGQRRTPKPERTSQDQHDQHELYRHQHVQELWQNWTLGEGLLETRWRSVRQSTSNDSNTQKGKSHKKGKGKANTCTLSKRFSFLKQLQPCRILHKNRVQLGELSCNSNVEPWIMGVTIISMSTRRQAGVECFLLDSGAQLHACPITYPGQKGAVA